MTSNTFLSKFNNALSGLFKDNNNKEITEARMRTLVTDISGSVIFSADNKMNLGGEFGLSKVGKISLGSGDSFTINLHSVFPELSLSGNFRYGEISFFYFVAGRATIEKWLFSATNAGVVGMTLVTRNSAGAAITGTPSISSSTNSALVISLTTDVSLASGGYTAELAIV